MTAIASLLADHVAFQLDSVDRLFIAGYVPELQYEGGVVRFLIERGYRIPSPAGLGHNHDRLVADIETFVAERSIPLVRFSKGESKEEAARPYLAEAERQGREGVVLVGKAQERVAGWRGFKDTSWGLHSEAHPHFTYRRQALFVDHFYFYVWDAEWGPGFIKLCPYAPYGMWAWLNGQCLTCSASIEPGVLVQLLLMPRRARNCCRKVNDFMVWLLLVNNFGGRRQ